MSKKVMIYSNEHQAWWKPEYCGYTINKARAGVFDYDEAIKRHSYIDYDTCKEDYFVDLKIQPENVPDMESLKKLVAQIMPGCKDTVIEDTALLMANLVLDRSKEYIYE